VDWDQKASAAIGFIKPTKTLRKKPYIALKKPQFHQKCISKALQSLKKPQFLWKHN
jgi:hypothetical protein